MGFPCVSFGVVIFGLFSLSDMEPAQECAEWRELRTREKLALKS